MKFKYLKFPLSQKSDYFGSAIFKPIIPINIIYHDKTLRYNVLIDSGADFCIFDASIGEYLGINIPSGPKTIFGGIQPANGACAFLHNITLDIGGYNYKTTISFSYDIAKRGFGILGQKGFFDIFVVKFDLIKEEIELKGRN